MKVNQETVQTNTKAGAVAPICLYYATFHLRLIRRCMALSLAAHNIRVNGIGPGSIMTEVLAAVASDKSAMNR